MLLHRRIWVSPTIYMLFSIFSLVNGAIHQREQIPPSRQLELSFWRWSATQRCRRRLKQNLTMPSMENFRNIVISFPFLISRRSLKKLFGMLKSVVYGIYLFMLNVPTSFRWEPTAPLGKPLFLPDIDGNNKLTSSSRQGVPHLSTNDDLYNDYHIPANSLMVPNQW